MNYQNQKQLEMFEKCLSNNNSEHNQIEDRQIMLPHNESNIRKLIIGIIIFIVVNLLTFSFGVERGVRLAKDKDGKKYIQETETITNTESVVPLMKSAQDKAKVQDKTKVIDKTSGPKLKPSDSLDENNYSIQVASYRKKLSAEKEADSLRKKGYTPFVLKKGNYIIVCVGAFKDKSDAGTYLNELKKKYTDSFVRRL